MNKQANQNKTRTPDQTQTHQIVIQSNNNIYNAATQSIKSQTHKPNPFHKPAKTTNLYKRTVNKQQAQPTRRQRIGTTKSKTQNQHKQIAIKQERPHKTNPKRTTSKAQPQRTPNNPSTIEQNHSNIQINPQIKTQTKSSNK